MGQWDVTRAERARSSRISIILAPMIPCAPAIWIFRGVIDLRGAAPPANLEPGVFSFSSTLLRSLAVDSMKRNSPIKNSRRLWDERERERERESFCRWHGSDKLVTLQDGNEREGSEPRLSTNGYLSSFLGFFFFVFLSLLPDSILYYLAGTRIYPVSFRGRRPRGWQVSRYRRFCIPRWSWLLFSSLAPFLSVAASETPLWVAWHYALARRAHEFQAVGISSAKYLASLVKNEIVDRAIERSSDRAIIREIAEFARDVPDEKRSSPFRSRCALRILDDISALKWSKYTK